MIPKKRPTQRTGRAPGLSWWESARFQTLRVTWSLFRFDGDSCPAHQRVPLHTPQGQAASRRAQRGV
jgi:hypothetical protein